MNHARRPLLVLAIAASTIFSASLGSADELENVRFAAPVRLKAGDAFLGEGRLYPSPVLYDVNGDKRADILVGDLVGKVTVALREGEATPVKLGVENPLNDRDGKPLKFHNW